MPTPTSRSGPGRSRSARSSSWQASSPIRSASSVPTGSDVERVRIAEGRGSAPWSSRAPDHPATAQVLGELPGHPPQLVVQALRIADVTLEGLLLRDRDPLGRDLERPPVDPAGSVAELAPDLPAQHAAAQVVIRQRRDVADRLIPTATSRSSARGPIPGRMRIGNGARNSASLPGRTTVQPTGLAPVRRDLRDPPSSSRRRASTRVSSARARPPEPLRRARARRRRPGRPRRGRGSPHRSRPARPSGRSLESSTRPRGSSPCRARAAAARRPLAGSAGRPRRTTIAEWMPKPRAT